MVNPVVWSEGMVAELLACYHRGFSASVNAEHMNREFGHELAHDQKFTRNSVIGKLHRLGYKRAEAAARKAGKPLGSFGYRKLKKVERRAGPRRAVKPGRGRFVDIRVMEGESFPDHFDDVEPRQCRWPRGDAKSISGLHCCGQPTVEGAKAPYCEYHLSRAYQKRRDDGGTKP